MNKSYYRFLARILLYKFNKYYFQGNQKIAFKKRFMRPALKKIDMKDFWIIHEDVKIKSNRYLIATGSYLRKNGKK